MKRLLALTLLAVLAFSALQTMLLASGAPETPVQMWEKVYVGGAEDAGWAVIQTNDGGYAVACNTWRNGGMDFKLIKTDASGNMQWSQAYGGGNWDGVNGIVSTSDGGYALAGTTGSFGAGGMDMWLVKTGAAGNMEWNRTYGGAGQEYSYALVATSDGGFAVTGHTFSSVAEGRENFWLVKTDASGNMLWNQTYGGAGSDHAYALTATADGGYFLAGSTGSFGFENGNSWLIKIDASGKMQWNRTYGGPGWLGFRSIIATADGGYALAGTATDHSSIGDFWLLKIDASGNVLLNQTYGAENEHAYQIVASPDGGYAIVGFRAHGTSADEADAWLIKTDRYGNMTWSRSYGSPYADAAYTLVATSDGGYALAGTWSYLVNRVLGGSVWLIKTDQEGRTSTAPPSPTPPASPKPTSNSTPIFTPTQTPTNTPTQAPTPTPTTVATQSPTPSTLNTTPPSSPPLTQVPTKTTSPKPTTPSGFFFQQPMPKMGQEPTGKGRTDWGLIVVAASAVIACACVAVTVCEEEPRWLKKRTVSFEARADQNPKINIVFESSSRVFVVFQKNLNLERAE
jgi:hypothetical protein